MIARRLVVHSAACGVARFCGRQSVCRRQFLRYVFVALVIVRATRGAVANAIPLLAVPVDRALVVFATQALKDSVFVLVVAVAAVRIWSDGLDATGGGARRLLLGAAVLGTSVYVVAGIRPHVVALFSMAGVARQYEALYQELAGATTPTTACAG